jgi:uncharacterized protein (TIGR02444 family)
MTDLPAHPIWDFVRAAYGRPGVSPAFLALQARHGADVDLLLYAAWIGTSGRGRLAGPALAKLRAAMAPWQSEILLSLRSLRRLLKQPIGNVPDALAQPLRQRVMTTEIEAERAQLLALAADAPQASERSESERRADVAANLSAGLALFRVGAASADDERDLKTIAEGCF